MIMSRVLRLGKTAGSSPDRGGFVGPGFGCIRRSIAPHRTGNHGEVMSARQAPLIGSLRWHGWLHPVRGASLSGCQIGRSGQGHVPRGACADARVRAAASPRQCAAVAERRFLADPGQDDHSDEQSGSAAGRCVGMTGPSARWHLNGIRVVSPSVSWFHGVRLSLSGGSMGTGISPMFESCLPPDNVSLCTARWDFAPERGLAWCGSR
jgi:hypothetical protein